MQSVRPIVVSEYRTLRDFVARVSETCSGVSKSIGQTSVEIPLLSFMNSLTEKTWLDVREALATYVFILFYFILFYFI